MQYVSIKFRPTDKKAYINGNPFETAYVGDKVKILSRDGYSLHTVVAVSNIKPKFKTRDIEGIIKP